MNNLLLNDKKTLTEEECRSALDLAVKQVRKNIPLYSKSCQNHSSVNGVYPTCANDQWTCGFWVGELWLCYEYTKEDIFRDTALEFVKSFYQRIKTKTAVDHHDMGFLYTPSCTAAFKLVGDETAKTAAIMAADQLLTRFNPNGEFFQAWGPMGATDNNRFIVDCLMNLPLLYWASEITGDDNSASAADKHTATCFKYSFREDGSTFHTFYMHPDGKPNRGETCQGYRYDSIWARGQTWGIYGSILNFHHTGKPECLELFRKSLKLYLSKLPGDMVPYWDMVFEDGSGEPRDSSSAAIAACGLLEAEKSLASQEGNDCRDLAGKMLKSLFDGYANVSPSDGAGLLLHGTYSKKSPYNTCVEEGVDEFTSWGDYFYLEGLMRYLANWNPYWW